MYLEVSLLAFGRRRGRRTRCLLSRGRSVVLSERFFDGQLLCFNANIVLLVSVSRNESFPTPAFLRRPIQHVLYLSELLSGAFLASFGSLVSPIFCSRYTTPAFHLFSFSGNVCPTLRLLVGCWCCADTPVSFSLLLSELLPTR